MSITRVPAIPAPTDTNLREVTRALKGVVEVREGLIGDPLDKGVTFRDLVDGGIAASTVVNRGGGSGAITISPAPGLGSGGSAVEPDLTPPPQPTGLAASASIATVILSWSQWSYGNHAYTEVWRSADNVIGNAVFIGSSDSQFYSDAIGVTGATFYYWVRFRSTADVVGPYNATNGVVATTGKIGNTDLGPLIVEAANLASGAVTLGKLSAGAVDATKFASGIEPVTIVTGTLPTTKGTNTIFRTNDSKTYRWDGTAYVASVATSDLSGTIADAQIDGVAASKVTGQITGTQIADAAVTTAKFASSIEPLTIVTGSTVPTTKSTSTIFLTGTGKLYRWDSSAYVASVATSDLSGTIADAQIDGVAASKVTGQITGTQIADAAVTTAKFASGIKPIEIVAALPTTGNFAGRVAFLTTDNKLYRHTGSAWVSSVASADIDGTISNAQIDGVAASKVTGQLTDAQIAAVSAAKVTGQLTASQLNVAIGGGNLLPNASFELDSNADGLADNWAIYTGGTTPTLSTSAVNGSKAQQFLADGVSATPRLTLTDQRPKLISGQAYVLTAWVRVTGTAYLNFKTFSAATGGGETNQGTGGTTSAGAGTYQRLTLKFTAPNSDFFAPMIGATGTPAANATILVDGVQLELGDVETAFAPKPDEILPGTITATEISDNAITTPKLVAGAVVAGKIAANAVSATEIAAGAITTTKIAAGAITTDKLVVTGRGSALNDDPFTSDVTAWPPTELWAASWTIATITDGPSGSKAIRSNAGANAAYAGSRQIAFNPNKAYRVRCKARSASANGVFYLVVDLRNSAGSVIGGDGTAWFYPASGVTVPGAWTDYEGRFGFGTGKTFPAEARTMSVGALMNYNGSAGYHEVQDIRIEEMADASLIVDGAIVADKIAANAITAAKIEAGAVTTAKLAAGAVTANEIAAATITGGKIAAATITGSNIVADTITSAQIAAGAISASEIAAGAISVQKLLVVPVSLCPDPFFDDQAWWGATQYDAAGWFFEGGAPVGAKTRATLWGAHPTNAPGSNRKHLWSAPLVPPAAGATLRLRCRAINNSNQACHLLVRFSSSTDTFLSDVVIDLPTGTNAATDFSVQGTVPADAAFMRFIIYNDAGTVFSGVATLSGVMLDVAASADLIVDGAIVADKIAANAITAGKIATDAVTADKVAANAITTAKIAAGSIDASKIAANTITAAQIAADTITAGQIAAGAIGATEIAAKAVTAEKLVIAGNGASLWADTCFQDPSAWVVSNWHGLPIQATITDGIAGGTSLRSPTSTGASARGAKRVPVTVGKTYRLSLYARRSSDANGTLYFRIDGSTSESGAYEERGYWIEGQVPATSWTRYTASVVAAQPFWSPMVLVNYSASAGWMEAQDIRIEEVIPGELIVDGAITADKISANAITAAKIEAGAVTTAKLAAGAVTANEIAAATITGGKIAAGTITGANIAADTITAGQIAAGAIGATEIASKVITTDKLVLTNSNNIITNPVMAYGRSGYAPDSAAYLDAVAAASAPANCPTAFAMQQTVLDAYSEWFDVIPGEVYNIGLTAAASAGVTSANIGVGFRIWSSSGNVNDWQNAAGTGEGNFPSGGAWTTKSGQFTVPATAIRLAVWIHAEGYRTGTNPQPWFWTNLRVTRAASADLIVDGAITADKISANAITAGKIEAGAVTTAKLAAGAVTANEIAAATITGGKIAAGTITGANIAADTITAGQIAAGAISASEIAAGAITTDKLFVTGRGSALNDDPNTQDVTAWIGSGLSIITDATSPAGNTVLRCAAAGATVLSSRVAIDPTRNHQFRIWTRQETGSSTTYLTVAFEDANGANISGGTAGWAQGTYYYFGLVNGALPAAWTEYRVSFGPNEAFTTPTGTRYVRVGVLSNYNGTGTQLVTGVRLMLKADADLIVDGAITADKIAANAITAGKIAANAIAVGTAAIQNGAINNAMIADATITTAKIVDLSADKITAGSMQVGSYLQSSNYGTSGGTQGWRINADGTAILNNVQARGDINATSGAITGATISTALSGQRIVLDSRGLLFLTGASSGKYGTFKYSAKKYGSGALVFFNNADKRVPFYVSGEQNVADIHLYNRGANPTGATYEAGDMIVVNGRLRIFVPALGGWKQVALE